LIAFFGVYFVSCSYNFSDDNYISLEEPSIDGISISLNGFIDGDTINTDKFMFYRISQRDNQFAISTEILVDNNRIASSSRTDSGEFTLRPSRYDDGEHTIRIIHKLSSGTGSIAEQQQLETLTVTKDFQFIINRKPSTPPAITAARIENGSITLEWQNDGNQEYVSAYLSLKFPDYERKVPITSEMLEQGSYIDTYTVLFPLDSNRREQEDRSRVEYSIVLVSEFEEVTGQGATLEHNPSWLDVSMSFVDLESFMVTWPEHPLYANFDSYRISILTDFSSEGHVFSASTQGGSQLIDAPYTFGEDYFGYLFPETEYDPYIPSYRFNPRLDENSFKPIQYMQQYYGKDFIFNPSTQRYYLLAIENNASAGNRGISIFEYSLDLEQVKRTLFLVLDPFWSNPSFNMVMDPESNNFYLDIGYRTRDLRLINLTMELDKNNLNKLKEFSEESSTSGVQMQLRGNVLKTWDYYSKQLTLTNVDTNETFYSLNTQGSNNTDISYLSDDGKYIYLNLDSENAIYKIENNNLEKRVDLVEPPGYSFSERAYSIDIYNDKLYYASYSNNIIAIDLIANQTTNTISYQAGNNSRSVSYDPFLNKLLLIQGEVCYMANLDSNTISNFYYESDKGYSAVGGDYFLWLTNGKLIHSRGIYVEIE